MQVKAISTTYLGEHCLPQYAHILAAVACTYAQNVSGQETSTNLYKLYQNQLQMPTGLDNACGTCPIEAIWLPCVANFSFVFLLVSPAGFVGSEQD